MKMVPELKNFDLFDSFLQGSRAVLKTDIYEKDGEYRMEIEMPGYKKEDIRITLEDGTLKIDAKRNNETSQSDENGKVVRKERISGSVSRSFYLGNHYTEQDIHASFDNGELIISMPSKEKKIEETRKMISID